MKKNLVIMWLAIIALPSILIAQSTEDKTPLAILPFVLSKGALIMNPADVVTVQEIVTKEFSDKSRFTVLDRSKFDKIIDELKIQSMEEFLNSKIVEQGKQLGAKYLVAGVVNEYKVNKMSRKFPIKVDTYPCTLKMSFGVIDVETGQLVSNNPINVTSNDIYSADSLMSMKKALTSMQDAVQGQIKNIFAGSLKILDVDKRGKDGLPMTVLINGGGTVISGKEKTKLIVYIEKIVAGGYKREQQIGELRSSSVEKEVVVCDVKGGAKEIDDALKANAPMLVKIVPK